MTSQIPDTSAAVAADAVATAAFMADPMQVATERALELLATLGPAQAVALLGEVAGQAAANARTAGGPSPEADTLAATGERIVAFAADLQHPPALADDEESSDGDESDEEGDDHAGADRDDDDGREDEEGDDDEPESAPTVAAPTPPRARRGSGRRTLAGPFEIGPNVETVKLRRLSESGPPELLGLPNALGVSKTEWPAETMTQELIHKLARGRDGQYVFQYVGRNAQGKRVGVGRSPAFPIKAQKRKVRSPEGTPPPASHAPATAAGMNFEQLLAWQRYQDERNDKERARLDRERDREAEAQRHREELQAKVKIEQIKSQRVAMRAQAEAAQSGTAASAPPGFDPQPFLESLQNLAGRVEQLQESGVRTETSVIINSVLESPIGQHLGQYLMQKVAEGNAMPSSPSAPPVLAPYRRVVPPGNAGAM